MTISWKFGNVNTHLLGFYISVFTLFPPVNFLCCAYMTNSLIQKVKATESKHLTQKHYVSSSLRVFVQTLFLSTKFFNVHMRMFCFSFYMTNFLNCVQVEGKVTERKLSKCFLKRIFSYSRLYLPTHCSSNVIVHGVCWSFVTMP